MSTPEIPTPETPSPEKEKKTEGRWALFTGVGSFVLYVFGYLSLRFHLSVLGVDTGLSVLDERYLFAGAQFLVYLVTSIPEALVLVVVVLALRWLVRRVGPGFLRSERHQILFGNVFSLLLIQFVMRQCLPFNNLLLRRDGLPQPDWMQALLLDDTGILQPLYFSALVACVLGLAWLLFQVSRRETWPWPVPTCIFAFLVLVQFLMLPVNFGILVENQDMPRVTTIEGKEKLKPDVQAWRVWEGKDSVTFFVRRWDGKSCETERTLLTLENKRIEKTEISGYDRVLRLLYRWPGEVVSGCGVGKGVGR